MSTAKIYKIESLSTPNIYIGTTTKTYLSERFTYYRREYNKYLQAKQNENDYSRYVKTKVDFGNEAIIELFKLFDLYGLKSFKIILLQQILHTSPDDLKSQLYEFIKKVDCINKKV
jgi:hypothetical protein